MADASTSPHFCVTCGAALRPNVKFCASCGHQVPHAGTASAAPAVSPPGEAKPPPPPVVPVSALPAPPSGVAASPDPAWGVPSAPANPAAPSRGLIIGLGVLAGALFVVGILGFALGGGNSAEVDRLERKQARLESSLAEARGDTSLAGTLTSDLDKSVSAWVEADDAADSTGNAFSDARDAAGDRSDAGDAAAFDDPQLAQALQAYADAVKADDNALIFMQAKLLLAREFAGMGDLP